MPRTLRKEEVMSRFNGWTATAVEKITGEKLRHDINLKQVVKPNPDYVGKISAALNILAIKHEREYKFLHDRRFRFDIAIPEKKVAVEFEGGIFTCGRHTRGKGYVSDAKKYNLATMHGWRLLRYTSDVIKKTNWEFGVANEIKNFLNDRNQ